MYVSLGICMCVRESKEMHFAPGELQFASSHLIICRYCITAMKKNLNPSPLMCFRGTFDECRAKWLLTGLTFEMCLFSNPARPNG